MTKFLSRIIAAIVLAFAFTLSIRAENLRIFNENLWFDGRPDRVSLGEDSAEKMRLYYQFSIFWDAAWRNEKNHDAAWVFVKITGTGPDDGGDPSTIHADIIPGSVRAFPINGSPDADITISDDGKGLFIAPASDMRGSVGWTVQLELDPHVIDAHLPYSQTGKAHGLEMVMIPEGPFYVGNHDSSGENFGAFYQSAGNGEFGGPYLIQSEQPISVSPKEGDLYYQVGDRAQFVGDQQGNIPAAFPKGYSAFYIMKYEIGQGNYAAFLNSLSDLASAYRTSIGAKNYYNDRGTIHLDNGQYVAGDPGRPANFIGWADGLAFLDWAGLRPMTDFEFTKAARGPEKPAFDDFPWGTNSKVNLMRGYNPKGSLVMLDGSREVDLNDSNRDKYGASYYWVMDLAGSLWERVVTIGHAKGRQYQGSHGDGRVTAIGFATNEDWPSREKDFRIGGPGYRGGVVTIRTGLSIVNITRTAL